MFQVREEIEFENLAKMYLREMIKRECWDEMVVKGRAVHVMPNCYLKSKHFLYVQCSYFIMLYLRSIGMEHVIPK